MITTSNNIDQHTTHIIESTKRTAPHFATDVSNGLKYFDKKTDVFLVATVAGEVAGFVKFRKLCLGGFKHNHYRISYMVVDKEHQHKGIGQELFNQALKQLKEKGAETVDLIYNKNDDHDGRLTRLYTQLGKTHEGIELSRFEKESNSYNTTMNYYFMKSKL